jgi:hypothetical protein
MKIENFVSIQLWGDFNRVRLDGRAGPVQQRWREKRERKPRAVHCRDEGMRTWEELLFATESKAKLCLICLDPSSDPRKTLFSCAKTHWC